MDLPHLFAKHAPPSPPRILSIRLEPTFLGLASFQVVNQQGQVHAYSEHCQISDPKPPLLHQAYVTALHQIDSSHASNLAVFGLPSSWVDDQGLKPIYKATLKEFAHQNQLKPLGYVITTDAIVQTIADQEGSPPSGILIEITPTTTFVALVYLGEILYQQQISNSPDAASNVQEGLARFPHQDSLPSRMLLIDHTPEQELHRQQLTAFDWKTSLPFLHVPKIELLPSFLPQRAIAQVASQEVMLPSEETEIASHPDEPAPVALVPSEVSVPDSAVKEITPSSTRLRPQDEFGFSTIEITSDAKPVPSEFTDTPESSEATQEEIGEEHSNVIPAEFSDITESKPSKKSKFSLPSLPTPRIHFSFSQGKIRVVGLITTIVSLIALAYILLTNTAQVTLYIKPQIYSSDITVTFDPTLTEPDTANLILPISTTSTNVTDTLSIPTTGTATVGEQAKGTIAIFNRTSSAKSFTAGTRLTSNGLTFTLDQDVQIASASTVENPDFSLTTEPSKAEVSATAVSIGGASNLPANTVFDVANFDSTSYIARAVTDFTGGFSQEVKAVAEKDFVALKASLVEKLVRDVEAQINQTTSLEQFFILPPESRLISDETFSHKVGQQADQIELSLSLSQTVYVYSKDHLVLVILAQAGPSLTPGMEPKVEATKSVLNIDSVKINPDDTLTADFTTQVVQLPLIDTADIAQKLAGKYLSRSTDHLKSLTGAEKVEAEIRFGFANQGFLPFNAANITIKIKDTL